MPDATVSGADFKKQLREGKPKMGLFLNAHSPTVAEQLAHSGYDWLLIDTQHGPMGYERLSAELSALPVKAEVWPAFLRDNACRAFRLPGRQDAP